jgi:hypothetical protein
LPNQHKGNDQSDKRQGSVNVNDPGEDQKRQKVEKKPRSKPYISNQAFRWITLAVDVLVFAAVAIYSFFAYQQWQAMRDQIRIAEVQLESANQEQRAWLTVVGAKLTKPLVVGQRPSVTLEIQNSGKTLAYDMQIGGGLLITEERLSGKEGPYDDPARYQNHDFSKGLVAPHAVAGSTRELEIELSKSDFEGLRNGKMFLYNAGIIVYRDTFKVLHKTTYCYWMSGKDDLETLQLHNCGYGNTAD